MSEVKALRERLSRMSEACLRINENLVFETVLQGVMDSARSLTGARYGMVALYDDDGWILEHVTSGTTPEQSSAFWEMRDGMKFQKYLGEITEPLRLSDFQSHTRAMGIPEFRPPFPVSPAMAFLGAPIRHRGKRLGVIYVSEKDQGFSSDDEETLVMFASQAALVISNARSHREEQRARADLETLVNTAPVGVLVFDAQTGAVTMTNREVRRIYSVLGVSGDSIRELFKAATYRSADTGKIPRAALRLTRAMRGGEGVRAEEIVIEAPDGRSLTTIITTAPILSKDGAAESVVVTVQDMSPLEEAERLRTEFLGIVSHELRGPLISIKGSASTLLEGGRSLDPAEMKQYFRIINEQADYMRDLIGDLIDSVRIETGTLSVDPQPVEVIRLVDEARNDFLSAGGRDNVVMRLAADLPRVMADRRRIVQVVNNLLSNAARNSPEASAIRVGAVREGVYVSMFVSDDGRGVPAERLPHLFRKFSRSESSDNNRDLGLGLSICKGIVEAHGGRVWAESDGPGLGSRFVFTLPVADEHPAKTVGPPRASAGWRTVDRKGKTRVLAVDDDPRTLKHIRDALLNAGYEPVVAADPQQAACLMQEINPHVVLLDLMLPGTDGMELMRDLFAPYDVPVIFLSAYDQEELIARAFEMGAVDYMVKPFSPTELAARVKAALRKRPASCG